MDTFTKFDAADYLDSEEAITEYLTAALEDENPDVFLAALAYVAKVRGISAIAQRSGLGRESLYKALAPGANATADGSATVTITSGGQSFTLRVNHP